MVYSRIVRKDRRHLTKSSRNEADKNTPRYRINFANGRVQNMHMSEIDFPEQPTGAQSDHLTTKVVVCSYPTTVWKTGHIILGVIVLFLGLGVFCVSLISIIYCPSKGFKSLDVWSGVLGSLSGVFTIITSKFHQKQLFVTQTTLNCVSFAFSGVSATFSRITMLSLRHSINRDCRLNRSIFQSIIFVMIVLQMIFICFVIMLIIIECTTICKNYLKMQSFDNKVDPAHETTSTRVSNDKDKSNVNSKTPNAENNSNKIPKKIKKKHSLATNKLKVKTKKSVTSKTKKKRKSSKTNIKIDMV